MPRWLSTMIALLVGGALATALRGQDARAPLRMQDLPCTFCHTCDKPTPSNPCLRGCPRRVTAATLGETGPDVVILDELENLYLPVPFDHRGHAEMTMMTDGCIVCHHHSPQGSEHPACKTCHEISPKRDDVREPSLKEAYHRQCLNCHREWSGEVTCSICHRPKTGAADEVPTVGKILGEMHPPIPEPHTEIYEPKAKPAPGEKIIFRHKEHIHRFGLKCAECHREDNCSRCHEKGQEHVQRVRTLEQHHKPCANCHDVDNKDACKGCHWKEGEARPKAFDHADKGWALGKYHVELGCRTCHKRIPFRKPERDCNACHGDWQPDTFDHAVTGQVLDANHEDAGCTECHADRKFDNPPRCDGCHEKDEGLAFPAQRPGPLAIPSQREKTDSSGD